MTWHVTAILPADAEAVWPLVEPLLAPAIAMSGGRIDAESVQAWLKDSRYLLWVAHQDDMQIKAAFVTREAHYPCKRVLTIDICGGTQLKGWLPEADKVFRSHSRATGLDGVELVGRHDWARALKQFGWRQSAVICDVDL